MQENDTIFKQLYEKCELATIIYNDHDHILDINPAALALFNIASVTKSTEQFISGLLNIPDDIVNRVKSGETITYSKKSSLMNLILMPFLKILLIRFFLLTYPAFHLSKPADRFQHIMFR